MLLLQMTDVTREHCLEIIDKFEPCLENKKAGALGIDGKLTGIAVVGEGEQCLNAYEKSHLFACLWSHRIVLDNVENAFK